MPALNYPESIPKRPSDTSSLNVDLKSIKGGGGGGGGNMLDDMDGNKSTKATPILHSAAASPIPMTSPDFNNMRTPLTLPMQMQASGVGIIGSGNSVLSGGGGGMGGMGGSGGSVRDASGVMVADELLGSSVVARQFEDMEKKKCLKISAQMARFDTECTKGVSAIKFHSFEDLVYVADRKCNVWVYNYKDNKKPVNCIPNKNPYTYAAGGLNRMYIYICVFCLLAIVLV